MNKKRGLLGLLTAFISSLLTVTAFGYWNFSSTSSNIVTKAEANTEATVNQYTDDRAVAYLDNATDVYYTSIEKAMSVATSGRTVYVVPGLKDSSGNAYQIHVKKSFSIPNGVTLTLPYEGTTYFDQDARGASNILADSSTANVKTYRQTQVVLDEGVTITVASGGTLNIGGIAGGPGQGLGGQTSGNYCEITMSANTNIICNGGNINCFGYIKEYSSLNNGSMLTMNSGQLLTPFVIYDFKGGSATLGICNLSSGSKFCPFAIFDFCNIQVIARIYSTAKWIGRTMIYVSSSYYPSSESDKRVTVVGNTTSNTAVILTDGYIDMKYTPETMGISSSATNSKAKTKCDIYGTVGVGKLSLTVSGKTIDTSQMFFPISHKLNFYVKNGSVLNINQKTKFMNGSYLEVDNGGVVSITAQTAFYTTFTDSLQPTYPYPNGKGAAKFICNGTTNVTGSGALAGYLETGASTGKLNYSSTTLSVKSPESGGNNPSSTSAALGTACDVINYEETATGTITNGSTVTYTGNLKSMNYTSTTNPEETSSFAWYDASAVKPGDIDTLTITPSTGSSSAATAGSFTLTAEVGPTGHSSTNVSYSWSVDNSAATLSATTGATTTLKTPANSGSNDVVYKVTCTVTFTKANGSTGTLSTTGSYTATKKSSTCFAAGTLITMADGSQKPIDDIVMSDQIMTYNFFTGEYEAQPLAFVVDHGEELYEVMTLEFSDSTSLSIIGDHGVFDYDLNEFIYLTPDDADNYIGHKFVECTDDGYNLITLVNVDIQTKLTHAYSITSAFNYNSIANGILTSPPPGLFYNWVEMGGKLRYDVEKFNADVEKYGLYDYDVFEPYISYEAFIAFNGKYLRIPVEKGIFTFDYIIELINMFGEWMI